MTIIKNRQKNSWVLFLTVLLSFNSWSLFATGINDLRVEYLKNPVGIDITQPRFSWKMQSDERGALQTAYEIVVSTDIEGTNVVWNSGQVASGQSVHILYEGPALSPATRYFWKVNVWNQKSEKITSSETAFFETGLMDSGWNNAQWIKAPEANPGGNVRFDLDDDSLNGIPLFRTEFGLDKAVRSARLYSSGLGIYEVFINGKRIGTAIGDQVIYDEFKPGWTDYSKTIFYTTHDVTGWLTQGANAMGAQVSSGWWNGAISHGEYGNVALGFRAKLVIEYTDGTSTVVVTDPQTWKTSTEGPVRKGSIYDGETYDARKESHWTSAGFDDSNWRQTVINTDFKGEIKAFTAPPVQVRPELERTPKTITKYKGITATGTTHGRINITETKTGPAAITLHKGETLVYDLGQNMVGWVHFKVKGGAGSTMTIRFSEMLNDNGAAERGNDGPGGSRFGRSLEYLFDV
jgi:alpha-L-rhamnosidase